MDANQQSVISKWAEKTLFSAALAALLAGNQEERVPARGREQPAQADVSPPIPAARLEVLTDRFIWHDVLRRPATAAEIAAIKPFAARRACPRPS